VLFLRAGRSLVLQQFRAMFPHVLCAVLLGALCCVGVSAQSGTDSTGTGGRNSIQGRLVFPSGRRADVRLKVRLQSNSSPELWVHTDGNGAFLFRSLNAGSYTIIVEGGDDFATVTESVYIEPDLASIVRGANAPRISRPYTLQVYLQNKQPNGVTNKAGVVHAALAGVPKSALDLYNKALASAQSGSDAKAVEQLTAAIAIYPEFRVALTNLGIIYMKMKQTDKAIDPLRAALKLAPDDYLTLLTFGTALFNKRQFPEAEKQFRSALQKNTSSPSAHFYLGLILLQKQDLDGSEKAFKSSVEFGGGEVAVAHKYLGGIYWAKRDYQQAADQLETYLRLTPNAEDAPRLRVTIKEFRAKK